MISIGIDPGLSGGLAFIDSNKPHTPMAIKMPDTETDIWDWFIEFIGTGSFAMIERVHSMPGQGVASSFTFGRNYGFLRACLIAACVPFEEITPQKWQKTMGCLSHGDKNITKARAQQLFPLIKITHAIADAILIAEYCRRSHT